MTARDTARLYMLADALASAPGDIVQTIATIKATGSRSAELNGALDEVVVLAQNVCADPSALAKAMTERSGIVAQLGVAFEPPDYPASHMCDVVSLRCEHMSDQKQMQSCAAACAGIRPRPAQGSHQCALIGCSLSSMTP